MTIINETTELVENGYTWGFCWETILGMMAVVFAIVQLIFVFKIYKLEKRFDLAMWMFSLFAAFLIAIGIGSWHLKPTYREVKQYEVLMDNKISFVEVYNNYDIINQRGDIYILRDKNWESND